MIPYNNVIVTDYDGCAGFWEHGFHMWMISKGYITVRNGFYSIEEKYGVTSEESKYLVESFNESAALRRLPPIKDAIKYIRKLHEEHGYVFHCITAIPNTRDMYDARMENIENLFGKTSFERLTLCDHSANKQALLKEYEGTGCYWIEDLMKNALMGLSVGMRPLLMDHHYNKNDHHPGVLRVHNWKEIYEEIATP